MRKIEESEPLDKQQESEAISKQQESKPLTPQRARRSRGVRERAGRCPVCGAQMYIVWVQEGHESCPRCRGRR